MHRTNGSRNVLLPSIEGSKGSMSILVVGGDSVEIFRQQAGRHGYVQHWGGRKNRDLKKSIPKDTEAIVVVLDRVSHGLARKVRTEARRRGLPVFFQRRARHTDPTNHDPLDLARWLNKTSATESMVE
jgi:hypothetical protein